MAICKMCHKPIPDGMDFCEECENKRTNQADESYLDSLLSSVTAESNDKVENAVEYFEKLNTPPRRAGFEISHGVIKTAPVEDKVPEPVVEETVPVAAPEEIIPETAEEITDTAEDIVEDIPEAAEEIIDAAEEIPEAVEETAEDIAADIPDIADDIAADIPDIAADLTEEIPEDIPEAVEEASEAAEEIPEAVEEAAEAVEDIPEVVEEAAEDIPVAAEEIAEEVEAIPAESEEIIEAADEGAESSDDADVDELLDGLLADMDAAGAGEPEEEVEPIGEDDLSEIFAAAQQEHEAEGTEEETASADDLFDINDAVAEPDGDAIEDLLGGSIEPDGDAATEDIPSEDIPQEDIPSEDIPAEDIAAAEADNPEAAGEEPIVDLLDTDIPDAMLDVPEPEAAPAEEELPGPEIEIELPEPESGEGGEQLIDSTAVDSVLDDILNTGSFLSESDLESTNDEAEPPEAPAAETLADISELDVDSLLDDIDSGALDKTIESLDSEAQEKKNAKKKKNKEKKSLFERLFANIVEELTPEQIEEQKAKEEAAAKKKIEDAEKKKAQKALSKEEKEKQKAEDKAAKEEADKKKAEEKKRKAEEAKAKAQKKKEEKLALEALEVNEGRINRAGASILFVIFAVFAIFIILGTNIYYYNLSIKNAQTEFDRQHYNEAYYEVYGLRIKDKDIELYDKIMTVMYVNIQLSSYQNYIKSNNREKALDSLLKGLLRYDKYLELATLLDIEDDLNYVKSGILDALASEFQMSESDAYDMMKYVDNVDYSAYIYELLGDYEVDYQ
ncbi:MAG: hypothetical protein J5712_03310 [Lachnospiraceae bacterium]|nr:hypothetical protein [Lachnospiraceae bacterium]